eukprot:276297-Amphidinium_carterae.1
MCCAAVRIALFETSLHVVVHFCRRPERSTHHGNMTPKLTCALEASRFTQTLQSNERLTRYACGGNAPKVSDIRLSCIRSTRTAWTQHPDCHSDTVSSHAQLAAMRFGALPQKRFILTSK